jgi:hypothetical protein
MFTYDGIRSQLEWNSTLSPAKAPHPTAETKYLRKVRPYIRAVFGQHFMPPSRLQLSLPLVRDQDR